MAKAIYSKESSKGFQRRTGTNNYGGWKYETESKDI